MTRAALDRARTTASVIALPSPGLAAGAIVVGSFLLAGLLFRTHGYEVTPLAWEIVRHFSLFFVTCELAVVAIATRAGLQISAAWQRLRRADRIAVGVWLATFWVGSVLSAQPAYSIVAAGSWLVHLLFGLSVWHLARQARWATEQCARWTGIAIAVAVIGLFALVLMHFMQPVDSATLPRGQVFWPGAIPGFMGVRLFGVVMAYVALFGAGLILAGSRERWRLLGAALLALGFGALCWSATRAAIPAFFAALLCVPLLSGRWSDGRSWLLVGLLVVAAGALSVALPAPSWHYGTLNMLRPPPAVPGGDDITAGRLEIWRAVAGAIAERPFFGHGEGATRWLLGDENSIHVQPHNILLQLALHWGVVASGAAIWLFARTVGPMASAVRHEPVLQPYAMVIAAAGTAALFDGALYYPQMVMIPVAALAFVLARGSAALARDVGTQ